MRRLILWLIPAATAIALFTGISIFDSVRKQAELDRDTSTPDFTSYSEGINTVFYDLEGRINYTMQARRQIQYKDDSTEFEKPYIRLFQNGDPRWNIVANSGRISADQAGNTSAARKIDLEGNVEVYSLDEFGNRMIMSTEFLSVDPELETLQTDHPVSIVTNTVKQSSVGMFADLKLDEIVFNRDSRGSYEYTAQ